MFLCVDCLLVCAHCSLHSASQIFLCVSVCTLLSPLSITDPYESLVVSILSNLLVDGPASPFYQALLDANIGSDFSPMTG